MTEYEFTLVVSGDIDSDQVAEALFEAGCDDATIGSIDGVGYVDFARRSPSLIVAVRQAIDQVESVADLRVQRVEPDDLVNMREIAERLGRSREGVRLLITGQRGPGGFPPPASHLKARSRLWRWSEVAIWAGQNLGTSDDGDANVIASFNAALVLRESRQKLQAEERDLVTSLAG